MPDPVNSPQPVKPPPTFPGKHAPVVPPPPPPEPSPKPSE